MAEPYFTCHCCDESIYSEEEEYCCDGCLNRFYPTCLSEEGDDGMLCRSCGILCKKCNMIILHNTSNHKCT